MRTVLLIFLGIFGFIFVAALAGVYIIVFTAAPAEWVLAAMDDPRENRTVTYEKVDGNLLSGFTLRGLKVDSKTVQLNFENLETRYDMKESRAQGGLVVTAVGCQNCSVFVKDPVAFKAEMSESKEHSEKRQRRQERNSGGSLIIKSFLISNFQFKADRSKIPADQAAEFQYYPELLEVKEFRIENAEFQFDTENKASYFSIQKLNANTPWFSASANALNYTSKNEQWNWEGELTASIEPVISQGLLKKAADLKAKIIKKEDGSREYLISGLGEHLQATISEKGDKAHFKISDFAPAEYFVGVFPMTKLNLDHAVEGEPKTWEKTLVRQASFEFGNKSYAIKEIDEKNSALLFSDESGSDQFAMSGVLAAWPQRQALVVKSSAQSLEHFYAEHFQQSDGGVLPSTATGEVDYKVALQKQGLALSSDNVFAPIRKSNRSPASLGSAKKSSFAPARR